MIRREEAIDFLNRIHNGKYRYLDLPEMVGQHQKITIECPTHGVFQQEYRKHASGSGCRKCAAMERNSKFRLTRDEVIRRFKEVHGGRYSYDEVEYVNNSTKVKIVCPVHGAFMQTPVKHFAGHGCPKCRLKYSDTEHFVEECKKLHPELDYMKTVFVNTNTKVVVTCPVHGDFEKYPYCITERGEGCPKCSHEEKSRKSILSNEDFHKKCLERGVTDSYDLTNTVYKRSDKKIRVCCHKKFSNGEEHGEFEIYPFNLLNGYGCPHCCNSKRGSDKEMEMLSFIENIADDKIISMAHGVLNKNELDIYCPSRNLAFEFDGLFWHCELKKDNDYHITKTRECQEKGIRLVHIFEDEWADKKDIVKSRIKSLFGLYDRKVYARKCDVVELSSDECNQFLELNHLQGKLNSKYRYGLTYEGRLVCVMTFSSLRRNLGNRNSEENTYEMTRFCPERGTTVIGGASRLFKHFIKVVGPSKVISYSDLRWGPGGMYKKIGFNFSHFSKPNYYYVVGHARKNRFSFRKDRLVKEGFDPKRTEHEIMLERKIYRIYDCGNAVWVWNSCQ